MYKRLQNFGICTDHKCMTDGPRCVHGYCVTHCANRHEYWVGHVRADGTLADTMGKGQQIQAVAPIRPVVPEPGTSTELFDGADNAVFVPVSDNARTSGGKSGFPVKYVT